MLTLFSLPKIASSPSVRQRTPLTLLLPALARAPPSRPAAYPPGIHIYFFYIKNIYIHNVTKRARPPARRRCGEDSAAALQVHDSLWRALRRALALRRRRRRAPYDASSFLHQIRNGQDKFPNCPAARPALTGFCLFASDALSCLCSSASSSRAFASHHQKKRQEKK